MRIAYGSFSRRINTTPTPPAAGTWTPASMASIQNWWDPARNVVSSSGNVSSWTDVVGGIAATQGTTANMPTLSATSMNGLPGLSAATASGFKQLTTNIVNGLPRTCIAIGTLSSGVDNTIFSASSTGGLQLSISTTGQLRWIQQFQATDATSSITGASGGYAIYAATRSATPTYAFRISGTDAGSGTPSGTITTAGESIVLLNNGSNTSSNIDSWSGAMGDMILVSAVSSLSDIQKAEGYLAWKYSLASLLPAGHPYKSAAP